MSVVLSSFRICYHWLNAGESKPKKQRWVHKHPYTSLQNETGPSSIIIDTHYQTSLIITGKTHTQRYSGQWRQESSATMTGDSNTNGIIFNRIGLIGHNISQWDNNTYNETNNNNCLINVTSLGIFFG